MSEIKRDIEEIGLYPLRPELEEAVKGAVAEAVGTESVGGGDEYSAMLETICGLTDDSQPVEQYDGLLGVSTGFVSGNQSPVCQVQWKSNLATLYANPGDVSGVRWGTGTMISDDIMITCGHLFDQNPNGWTVPRIDGTNTPIPNEEIAQNMQVNFNFQVDPSGNLRTETSFDIQELVEYRLGGVDMAICRIAGNPGATFGTATVSTTDATVGDMICIIGHPAGRPKRIEAGPTTAITGNLIRYNDIDTLGGNSGSGILRASDSALVGVHTNGGCSATSPAPGGGSNFGLRIERFIEASPTLQNLTQPTIGPPVDIGKLKFFDDGGFKWLIDILKPKFQDDKFKNFDDVKRPGLDKPPGLDAIDPRFGGNPANPPQGAQPFILATPHHSNAWQTGGGGDPELAQLAASIQQVASQMQQLDAHYKALVEEYQKRSRQS